MDKFLIIILIICAAVIGVQHLEKKNKQNAHLVFLAECADAQQEYFAKNKRYSGSLKDININIPNRASVSGCTDGVECMGSADGYILTVKSSPKGGSYRFTLFEASSNPSYRFAVAEENGGEPQFWCEGLTPTTKATCNSAGGVFTEEKNHISYYSMKAPSRKNAKGK